MRVICAVPHHITSHTHTHTPGPRCRTPALAAPPPQPHPAALQPPPAAPQVRVPVEASFRPPIRIFNPHVAEHLAVKEIYTSESFMHLAMPDGDDGQRRQLARHRRACAPPC